MGCCGLWLAGRLADCPTGCKCNAFNLNVTPNRNKIRAFHVKEALFHHFFCLRATTAETSKPSRNLTSKQNQRHDYANQELGMEGWRGAVADPRDHGARPTGVGFLVASCSARGRPKQSCGGNSNNSSTCQKRCPHEQPPKRCLARDEHERRATKVFGVCTRRLPQRRSLQVIHSQRAAATNSRAGVAYCKKRARLCYAVVFRTAMSGNIRTVLI